MLDKIFSFRSEAFVTKEADNELVLVPLSNNIVDMTKILTLNEVASTIIQKIDGKKTLKEICDFIFEEYDVEREVLEKEVIEFVESAVKMNILHFSPTPD